MILEAGTQIGDYRILSLIASGAYGVVYEGQHNITQRVDALKLMLDSSRSAEDEQRFLREIQVQAKLQHPNIASVHGAFRTPYGLALVMERVRGESLRTVLERGKLPLAEGLRYMLDTLSALDYAEGMGIIHKDIKPENILIAEDGAVKLTDFGLAHVLNAPRITTAGESIGTPVYMSPEQVDGLGAVDARTDVYSTGVVLYEIVTGQPPFTGTNGFAVMRAHRETQPIPPRKMDPAIAKRLNGVVLKALQKDPRRRFQNAAAFRDALKHAVAAEQTPEQRRRLRPVRAAAAAVIGFMACGGTLAGGYWALRHRHQAAAETVQKINPPVPAPDAFQAPVPDAADKPEEMPAAPLETAAPEPPPSIQPAPTPVAAKRKPARKSRSARSLLPRVIGMEERAPSEPALTQRRQHTSVPEPPAVNPMVPVPAPTGTLAASPAPASNAAGDAPDAKKRNVVVRALGRIFGKKPSAPAPALPSVPKTNPTETPPKTAQ